MPAGRRAQAWRHQPAFRRPRHFHAEPEINLVVRGLALVAVGDRTVAVSSGQMLCFQPGQDHVLLDSSDDLELFVFALRPELAERTLKSRTPYSTTFELTGPELGAVAAELLGLGEVRDAAAIEERLANLFSLAIDRAPKIHVRSRRALEYLRSEHDLTEASLAQRLRTAPSGLSRRFHGDLGMTLVEYRARLRLMRFVELVDQGEPLSRAALEAEFGSYAQCHRVFRRALGCAPRDYFHGMRAEVDRETVQDSGQGVTSSIAAFSQKAPATGAPLHEPSDSPGTLSQR
jgi:AraC-like DNA-binding protein